MKVDRNGKISWQGASIASGSYPVVVRAYSPDGLEDTQSFEIMVMN